MCHFSLLSVFKTPGCYKYPVIANCDSYWQTEQVRINIHFYPDDFWNFIWRCCLAKTELNNLAGLGCYFKDHFGYFSEKPIKKSPPISVLF